MSSFDFEYQISLKLESPRPELELEELNESEKFQDAVDEIYTALTAFSDEVDYSLEAYEYSHKVSLRVQPKESSIRTLAEIDEVILRALHAIEETDLEIEGSGTFNLEHNPNPRYQRLPGFENQDL